ncbi:MAG: helix-turn-helix transcriptional regulator [Clostridiaceae bacterium]|nr:helix-turn-helix transcriptional regulator [Clostridiales bacterium]MDD6877884.1 helix-turn-helix transcriptional regulator [Clostridiaceae bacterium]MDY3286338.1 helix-turn-helix transcriptional regulator [Eubacteriales bacterium]
MTFGEKLRALRLSKKLTQAELAASLRVTSRTLINYELGKCMPKQTEVLARIATLFDVSVDYLMNDEEVCVRDTREHGDPEADEEVRRLLADVSGLFAGGRLSDEDRDYVMRAINDLYWEAREKAGKLPSVQNG